MLELDVESSVRTMAPLWFNFLCITHFRSRVLEVMDPSHEKLVQSRNFRYQ